MLELVVDNIIRPAAVYGIVDLMVYVQCVRNSIEYNHFIKDWRDHLRIGTDQFRLNPSLQLIPSGFVLLYYADKAVLHLAGTIQHILNQ